VHIGLVWGFVAKIVPVLESLSETSSCWASGPSSTTCWI